MPSISFKMKITDAFKSLYQDIERAGPYYRSQRMIQLASIGLAVESGGVVAVYPPEEGVSSVTTTPPRPQRKRGKIAPEGNVEKASGAPQAHQATSRYSIPTDASDALDGLFNTIDK